MAIRPASSVPTATGRSTPPNFPQRCSQCGYPLVAPTTKKPNYAWVWLVLLVVGVFVVAALSSRGGGSGYSPGGGQPYATQQYPAPQAPTAASEPVIQTGPNDSGPVNESPSQPQGGQFSPESAATADASTSSGDWWALKARRTEKDAESLEYGNSSGGLVERMQAASEWEHARDEYSKEGRYDESKMADQAAQTDRMLAKGKRTGE